MNSHECYENLAEHLSKLGMGYPKTEALIEILQENFSPLEAEIAMAIPTRVIPLAPVEVDEIQKKTAVPREELETILEGLYERGLLFTGQTESGQKGYALHQVGYGFPQTFFWKGEDSPHARKMAGLVAKYFNRHVTRESYSTEPKPYRYIPVGKSIEGGRQAVYPHHTMENIIDNAELIAVAHCPCRVGYKLNGRTCEHPTEVCMKFNDMARYVIEKGLGRQVNIDEARDIIKLTEEAGLVHFVDNAEGEIQHNCNCCGCACWNVGNIRRRKIPRDVIMATYFIRDTDEEDCDGCGQCEEICPVKAVTMEDGLPVVDQDWCIGCGVCATTCPADAVLIELRPDRTDKLPAKTPKELHKMILKEKIHGSKTVRL